MKAVVTAAIRVVAISAAQDAYKGGKLSLARSFLETASKAQTRIAAEELAHDLAVIQVSENHLPDAISALEKLTGRIPDAWVNLGVAYDRRGDSEKALDAWRRARKAGSRFPGLSDWIAAKERIYGAGQ